MLNLDVWLPYESTVTDAAGAQTNEAISPAIAADQRFEVIDLRVAADNANTGDVSVRIGFAAATLPAAAVAGVRGIVFSHPGMDGGQCLMGIPGKGLKGEELRLTCEDPAGGNLTITFLGRIVTGG